MVLCVASRLTLWLLHIILWLYDNLCEILINYTVQKTTIKPAKQLKSYCELYQEARALNGISADLWETVLPVTDGSGGEYKALIIVIWVSLEDSCNSKKNLCKGKWAAFFEKYLVKTLTNNW